MQTYEASCGSRTIILQATSMGAAIEQAHNHFLPKTRGFNTGVQVKLMPSVRPSNLYAH